MRFVVAMGKVLQPKEAANLYLDLLVPWERSLKSTKGKFNFEEPQFKTFCQVQNATFRSFDNSSELEKALRSKKSDLRQLKMVFYFVKGNNKAKNLLRHLRNSIAHGGVTEVKRGSKWYIEFEGKFRGKINLKGQLPRSTLSDFISAIMSIAGNA